MISDADATDTRCRRNLRTNSSPGLPQNNFSTKCSRDTTVKSLLDSQGMSPSSNMFHANQTIAYFLVIMLCKAYADYVPSMAVKAAHNLPHINYNLQLTGSAWDITASTFDTGNPYVQSIITFPAILLAIGAILFISLLTFWLLRYCGCMCLADRPPNRLLKLDPLVWVTSVAVRKNTLLGFFIVFMFLALCAATLSWFGYTVMYDGIMFTESNLKDAAGAFLGVHHGGMSISGYGATIVSNLALSTCAQSQSTYADAVAAAESMQSLGETMSYSVQQLSPKLLKISDLLHTFGFVYFQIGVPVYFGGIGAVCIMFAIAVTIRQKQLMIANVSIGLAIFITLFILCTLTMLVIMGLGDFCMAPVEHLLYSLTPGSYLQQYADYYLTCSASVVDPLAASYSDVSAVLSTLNTSFVALATACPNDAYIATAQSARYSTITTLTGVNTFRTCDSIQNSLLSAFNEGVCNNAFDGFFGVWLSFFVALPCLYIMCATGCVLVEYFDVKYWLAESSNFHHLTWTPTPTQDLSAVPGTGDNIMTGNQKVEPV